MAYYPKGVDLTDSELYDTDLPQRMMGELTISLTLPFYDLRSPLLRTLETCPYQPRNMHWTTYGHQAVADYLTAILLEYGYIPKI